VAGRAAVGAGAGGGGGSLLGGMRTMSMPVSATRWSLPSTWASRPNTDVRTPAAGAPCAATQTVSNRMQAWEPPPAGQLMDDTPIGRARHDI
jgi:hypothetical protein